MRWIGCVFYHGFSHSRLQRFLTIQVMGRSKRINAYLSTESDSSDSALFCRLERAGLVRPSSYLLHPDPTDHHHVLFFYMVVGLGKEK